MLMIPPLRLVSSRSHLPATPALSGDDLNSHRLVASPTQPRPTTPTTTPTHPPPCPSPRREGFSTRFGIVAVDFSDKDLPRAPKDSARYLQQHVFSKSKKQ